MSDGKDSGDSSASDQESSDLNKEYQENQQDIQEQTAAIDKMEMGFLHAQNGGVYQTPTDNLAPTSKSSEPNPVTPQNTINPVNPMAMS